MSFPKLIETLGPETMEEYRNRIGTDPVFSYDKPEYVKIFKLFNIEPAEYVRAIQENEMLKTKVAGLVKGRVVSLPSFIDVWTKDQEFRRNILDSKNPHEAKWALSKRYGYKLAIKPMLMNPIS